MVFRMREKRTLKREDCTGSKCGLFVNQVFVTEQLLTHLKILHNGYVTNQHFCTKVNGGFVEFVSLDFVGLKLMYDFLLKSQECVVCGKVLLGLRIHLGLHFIVFAA